MLPPRFRTVLFTGAVMALSGMSLVATQRHALSSAETMTMSPTQGPAGAAGSTGSTGATGATGAACTTAQNCQAAVTTTATDGTYTWTYPVAFAGGVVPTIVATAQATSGTTDVVTVQMDGAPTSTSVKIRVSRTTITSLLGINVLGVPASPGAVVVHLTARTQS